MTLWVLGSLLAFVVLLVAFGIGAARLTGWLVRRMVERRHRELEELVTYGRIPLAWTAGAARPGGDLDPRTRRRCLRRLEALRFEVQRSTLVADEETRRVLIERLAAVRARF